MPLCPFCTPLILAETISPVARGMMSLVSTSLMPCPSPAKIRLSPLPATKVMVPMPAEESRTQTPNLYPPSLERAGVTVVE